MQDSFGALVEAKQAVAIIVESASLDKSRQIGTDLLNLQSGNVFGEMAGMRTDIAHAASGPALLWIRAP